MEARDLEEKLRNGGKGLRREAEKMSLPRKEARDLEETPRNGGKRLRREAEEWRQGTQKRSRGTEARDLEEKLRKGA
uniref:Uncharacterized protein n=1 Tax=Pristionchus pacificus TaxID=54126 RepID=A0A2A6BD14_PRIPA|eukprot:PDM63736.1 hypothetical protein PRIPAC_49709 [Pristionchus pacificus]